MNLTKTITSAAMAPLGLHSKDGGGFSVAQTRERVKVFIDSHRQTLSNIGRPFKYNLVLKLAAIPALTGCTSPDLVDLGIMSVSPVTIATAFILGIKIIHDHSQQGTWSTRQRNIALGALIGSVMMVEPVQYFLFQTSSLHTGLLYTNSVIGNENVETFLAARQMLRSHSWLVRKRGIELLEKLSTTDAKRLLMDCLDDPHRDNVETAMLALTKSKDPEIAESLIPQLELQTDQNDHRAIQKQLDLIWLLGELGDDRAIPFLINHRLNHADEDIRYDTIQALQKLYMTSEDNQDIIAWALLDRARLETPKNKRQIMDAIGTFKGRMHFSINLSRGHNPPETIPIERTYLFPIVQIQAEAEELQSQTNDCALGGHSFVFDSFDGTHAAMCFDILAAAERSLWLKSDAHHVEYQNLVVTGARNFCRSFVEQSNDIAKNKTVIPGFVEAEDYEADSDLSEELDPEMLKAIKDSCEAEALFFYYLSPHLQKLGIPAKKIQDIGEQLSNPDSQDYLTLQDFVKRVTTHMQMTNHAEELFDYFDEDELQDMDEVVARFLSDEAFVPLFHEYLDLYPSNLSQDIPKDHPLFFSDYSYFRIHGITIYLIYAAYYWDEIQKIEID